MSRNDKIKLGVGGLALVIGAVLIFFNLRGPSAPPPSSPEAVPVAITPDKVPADTVPGLPSNRRVFKPK